jgi:hypothetical protein
MKKKSYLFNLKITDNDEFNKKFGFLVSKEEDEFSQNITNLEDLTLKTDNYSFMNEVKREKNCDITMYDYVKKKSLPEKTDITCFWCRHSFDTTPIGCPIRYVSHKLNNQYKSQITDDIYNIKENISSYKKENVEIVKVVDQTIEVKNKDYFETDGIFCSFNCCLSYIKDNFSNSLYEFSEHLLHLLYFKTFSIDKKISPAPNWRLLERNGGSIRIEDYRNGFYDVNYSCMGSISKIVKNKPIGYIFEKNIKI